jgi:hypothetical protein
MVSSIKSKFEREFSNSLRRQIFWDHSGDDLALAVSPEIIDQCCDELDLYSETRLSASGDDSAWEIERNLLEQITCVESGPLIYVKGPAGTGKSTLCEFVVRYFYRFAGTILDCQARHEDWRAAVMDALRAGRAEHQRPRISSYVLRIPSKVDAPAPVICSLLCEQLRDQILARYPSLPVEHEHAMWRGVNPQASIGPASDSEPLQFCIQAINYLHYRRVPEAERRKIVVLLDDIDPLGPDVAIKVRENMQLLVTQQVHHGIPPKLIIPVREETLRIGGYFAAAVAAGVTVDAGVPKIRDVLRRRSGQLRRLIENDADEVDVYVRGNDRNAEYLLPVPAPIVVSMVSTLGEISDSVCGWDSDRAPFGVTLTKSCVEGAQEGDGEESSSVVEEVLTPLIGNCVRRAVHFHERVAKSPLLDHRLRHGEPIRGSHVLRGFLTGESGTAASVDDETCVGYLWGRPDEVSGRCFANFVTLSVLTKLGGQVVREDGETSADSHSFLELTRALGLEDSVILPSLNGLVHRGFVQRYSENCALIHYGYQPVSCLRNLMLEPLYVDVCSLVFSGKGAFRVGEMPFLEEFKVVSDSAVRFLAALCASERRWMAARPGTAQAMQDLSIPLPATGAINAYVEGITGLKRTRWFQSGAALTAIDSRLDRVRDVQTRHRGSVH